jgi:acid stress-induced BolA-like protein IbaG/YrbA
LLIINLLSPFPFPFIPLIMSAITPSQVKATIEAGIPEAIVQITDLTGGGDHYQAVVISAQFEGKSLIQQHQLVYAAVREPMASGAIHALALKTYTPETWQAAN